MLQDIRALLFELLCTSILTRYPVTTGNTIHTPQRNFRKRGKKLKLSMLLILISIFIIS
jgi:hypothetical protein